ncbi:hypothetical protein PHYBOEH_006291 [Phytophthora boehmeriae]|uniref:Uncharacterized protein n=1 Tax=Phytophthora boehmeriae TaxID=109152 RepID=A0A8T1WL39_9STRA|nr:hypothetical protein PHYBOEH_006291 [Phytophthora boehmeriae]
MATASNASLPVGMQLVSALDDAETLSPVNSSTRATEHVRRALLLPLEGDNAMDVEMDIDVDVFRPSAMLDDDDEELFGSSFQPDLGDAEEDIEQMLLCGAEEGLQTNHQHDTAPGQGCQCRNFAIQANRVQTQEPGKAVAATDQKKVLRHTFGSGRRLQGFGFGEGAANCSPQEDVEMSGRGRVTPAPTVVSGETVAVKQEPEGQEATQQILQQVTLPCEVKKEIPSTPERVLLSAMDEKVFSTPQRCHEVSVSSPLSTTSFVSLENMMATPLSTMSRSTMQTEAPVMVRSLSPADELEKMAGGGAKTTVPKMNMLRGNFQVSPGQDSVPLVKPTPVLPPPYFRGALDSPEKRRAHSKTFNSFAQSLSFSFSNESSANT